MFMVKVTTERLKVILEFMLRLHQSFLINSVGKIKVTSEFAHLVNKISEVLLFMLDVGDLLLELQEVATPQWLWHRRWRCWLWAPPARRVGWAH